jgi:hypothetical protein
LIVVLSFLFLTSNSNTSQTILDPMCIVWSNLFRQHNMSSSQLKSSSNKNKRSATQTNIIKMAELLEQMAEGILDGETPEPAEVTSADESEEEEPEDKTPVGMLAEIKNLYQKPDKQGRNQW